MSEDVIQRFFSLNDYVTISNLSPIHKTFMYLPWQNFKCFLENLAPKSNIHAKDF